MCNKYIVALKVKGNVNPLCYGGYTYLKARPIEEKDILDMVDSESFLPSPKIGYRYNVCYLSTSPVIDFNPFKNGWEVKTENSLYRFIITDMDGIKCLVKENSFTGPNRINDESKAMYWS